MRLALLLAVVAIQTSTAPLPAPRPFTHAPDTILYRLSFPEPEHRWMQVEVTFPNVTSSVLQIRMSRTSPGRYALHEFAKNVYDEHAYGAGDAELNVARPNLHQWDVTGHGGSVRFVYKIYGDHLDGTYLAVDSTHAHINMPASLVWARDMENRAVTVAFAQPPHAEWRVATQLLTTRDPLIFTAPNLQYLMDSPAEFSAFGLREFNVSAPLGGPARFRVAVHHTGSDRDLDSYALELQRIAVESAKIYGEFPNYDVGYYTFLADYLPWAGGDGMEHRNSAVLTSSGSIAGSRSALLNTAAHELFHCWNVERIRPRSLEPFDFEQASISEELWLAEGVTSYYEGLIVQRAGLSSIEGILADFAATINAVTLAPGRQFRSAVDMSRLAPFVDDARAVDRTNWPNTFLSYYTYGKAIGLGLDLALRDRTNGRVTLDHYMRALWVKYGKGGGPAPGIVAAPYTLDEARDRLADVSDRAFADEFFGRYIEGRDVVDYARLLARAGIVMRPVLSRAWMGDVQTSSRGDGVAITAPVSFGSPAYAAGLEQDDVLQSVNGESLGSNVNIDALLTKYKPGDRIEIRLQRRGEPARAYVTLAADPRSELVLDQNATADQHRFRTAWLGAQ